MRTNFRDLNSTDELSCFFHRLGGITDNGGCRVPLGQFNGVNYSFLPTSSILQLEDKVQDQRDSAETAPATYFCVQKRNLDHALPLPWGGSSASASQTYATNIARSLSLRSVHSEDSGYASGNAHPVSENLLTISEDNVEHRTGLGLRGGRKASLNNRDRERKLSLHSVRSEDSGYASGENNPVSGNLAAITEDWSDKQAEFGFLNRPKRDSASDLVLSFPFFTFGRLFPKPTSSDSYPTDTDFIVAVSLADCSLWAIYDAWDEDWIEPEDGGEADWMGEERFETPLKPLRSNNWGKLPGIDGRVRMARLAESVYTHNFAASERIYWTIDGEQWGPNEIPALFPAVKALTGLVTPLTHASQSKDSATQTS